MQDARRGVGDAGPGPPRTAEGFAKPIVLVRTDFRAQTGSGAPYNPMLTESATIRLDLPFAPIAQVIAELLDALERFQEDSR